MAINERPRFKIAQMNPDLDNALMYVLGYDSEADLVNHFEDIRHGRLGDGGFNCCFPSVLDPTRARTGQHIGLISQEAPYKLAQDGAQMWYRVRREHAERCKAVLAKYAPNMTESNVLYDYIGTPLDTENKFPNMKQGCFKEGAYLPLQMGYFRPNELCSQHSTPIKGLYLCGSCTHSGGMITYGPGYNATQQIAEDLKIEKWWPEPSEVTHAREVGLL
jgi:phytoene dehydrogenase-like protein